MSFRPDPKVIDAELAILNDSITAEERPQLVAFIEQLQAATTPDDFFELHRELLVRYWARQRVREELNQERAATQQRLRELVQADPKPLDEIKGAQRKLALAERQDRVQVALAAHLRAIADGLVWKALQYDRSAITILSRGTRVDRLADDGVGLQAELNAIGELWDREGAFTVHNDLTTVLRHGDLTTINVGAHSVEIREIKATRPAAADSPQIARLSAATELINAGCAIDPETGKVLRLHRLPVEYRTSLACLAELTKQARIAGYAARQLNEMQHVAVIDYRVWAGREDELGEHDRATQAALGWGDEQKTFSWMSSLRRIRDRRHSVGSLAPLAIFPASSEDLADLMLGRLELHSMLRCDLLGSAFADRGIKVEIAFPDGDNQFLVAQRGRFGVEVPPAVREQMMLELMTPETLMAMVDEMLKLIAASPEPDLSTVGCDEHEAWR